MTKVFFQRLTLVNQSTDNLIDKLYDLEKFLKEKLQIFFKKEEFVINYIFLNVSDILKMNKQYLKHDYPTDVISFDFSDDFGVFGGDIFICPQIVRENAKLYHTDYEQELLRVIFHGILHLLGFDDRTDEDKEVMNEHEELLLEMYRNYY